jgi:hypothetical protein
MSMSVFQIGLLTAGLVFLIGGAALAVIASRIAAAGRAAQTEADIRLAFLRHNDACMASVQSTLAAHTPAGCSHGETANTHLSGGHHDDDDDDDHHKKHHSLMSGGHHDDDDDDDHKKHHAANDEAGRPSFFARLFRRYP